MSFYIIRGGYFGFEFTIKLLWILLALTVCIYEWKKNKRKDYFWVFLLGCFIYLGSEIGMYFSGARVISYSSIFGIDISSYLWLTIPIQAFADVPSIIVVSLFVSDRLMKKESRKNGIILAAILLFLKNVVATVVLVALGYNYANISVGDPNIYQRRDIFSLTTVLSISGMILLTAIWFIRTDKEKRKRAIYLFLMIVAFIAVWTLGEWLSGQRWIEVAVGLSYIKPSGIVEFAILAYDTVVEMGLFGVSFLAIPYLTRLIKTKKEDKQLAEES